MNNTKIDWNSVWKEQYEANMHSRGAGDCALLWDTKEQALKFYQMTQENPERVEMMLSGFSLSPGKRVLDIGAGPGTLSIPLAGQVGTVTAVEPARGMVAVMEERMQEKNIQNLIIVNKRWEDIDIRTDLNPPYDLVIASYSLGMPDIRTAIEKMENVCSGEIWLFWFAGTTSWEEQLHRIWPKIHGRDYVPSPKSDVLFNVLYQMNIYPDIRVRELEQTKVFSTLTEAVEDTRRQLRCTPDHDDLIRDFLAGELVRENGKYLQTGTTQRVSLSWSVKRDEI